MSVLYKCQELDIIITILCAKSAEKRWSETMSLAYWAERKLMAAKRQLMSAINY